jgi:hypothetical protein
MVSPSYKLNLFLHQEAMYPFISKAYEKTGPYMKYFRYGQQIYLNWEFPTPNGSEVF